MLYITKNKLTTTKDYNDAGLWELTEAAEVCLNTEHALAMLCPDPSNNWLVIIAEEVVY